MKNIDRSEEIQHIIERMPTKFGLWTTGFVAVLAGVLLFFGWVIRYPDIVSGEVIMNTKTSPVKLVANTSGRIELFRYETNDNVKEGDLIGMIKNSARMEDVRKLDSLMAGVDLQDPHSLSKIHSFPHDLSLGELDGRYAAFLNVFGQLENFNVDNVYDKNNDNFTKQVLQYHAVLANSDKRLKMTEENLDLNKKARQRDSVLFSQQVLTAAENEQSKMRYNAVRENHQSMLKDITLIKGQLQQLENQAAQNLLQKNDKEKQMKLDLITYYTELGDNIKAWKERYLFRSPMAGKLQFLKFWTPNQFVQEGEPVFTIVPFGNKVIGQMMLPAVGAGKAKVGQEVIIKLSNYPYAEYGSITGKVSDISLTTNPVRTAEGSTETYLVNVELPSGLKTNYGKVLDFKYEIKGLAEIVTADRRLIERLFDNLSYSLNK